MARMLGRMRSSWCSECSAPPDPDCVDVGKHPRQAKRIEQRRVQSELEALVHEAAEHGLYESTAYPVETR